MEPINDIFQLQRRFFLSGKTLDFSFRREMLKKLRKSIRKFEPQIEEALYKDLGKSPFEAYATETGLILDEINFHLKHLNHLSHPARVKTPIVHFLAGSYIYPEPYGQVLIMGTWNYPLQITLLPLAGAISAGNCAVIKPSEFTPHSSEVLERLVNETFPAEYITVIQGAVETGQYLLKQKFDFIFFTGNSNVGKIVMEHAARNLTPVCLELGGKSPSIVEADADIELAARRIIWGKFINTGQTCIATDYIWVHKSVKEILLEKMKLYIDLFFGENPRLSPDYGRIINEANMNRLISLMKDARIVKGGEVIPEEKYIAPTIIDEVNPDDAIMQQEIFGPLLPVMSFENIQEVMDYMNNVPKPLAVYYFSKDRKKQKMIVRKLPAGGICINETVAHYANHHLPFGGVGNSGIGSCHGKYTFQIFSHYKPVMVKSNWIDITLRYPPYKNWKIKILRKILG